jgi:hypothetical protein
MNPSRIATTTDTLEELLHIEVAAAETYDKAIGHAGNHAYAPTLVELKREHDTAAGSLRNLLARFHDCEMSPNPGVMAAAAKAVERVAAVFGPDSTVRALRAGERSIAAHLTRLADDNDLAVEARTLVSTTLLPATRQRAAKLDDLLAMA